ncbi:MAG: hypothetical protein GY861_06595, partial [bacterium]|nr:hypothetical protein [bacterium]
MVRTSILYGAQDASMTIFVARALAIITSKLPIPKSTIGNPVWIREFQQDILKRTQRPIHSCPEITLAHGLEISVVVWTEIASLFNHISGMILAEKSAKSDLDVSCIDWAFKRISLAQFAVFNLLQGNAY